MLLLAKIFGFIDAALFIILAIVDFAAAGGAATQAEQATMISNGVTLTIFGILSLLGALMAVIHSPALEALVPGAKNRGILCIVFGAIGSNPFLIVGAILTLVLNARKPAEPEAE